MLGPLPEFLQDEFERNSRYTGLKFPEIKSPETLEARYAAVMNDTEIDLMQKMLTMDPYSRVTARQAIEHEYFDKMRATDPEYMGGRSGASSSVDASENSRGRIRGADERVLSPELLAQRNRGLGTSQEKAGAALSNKVSYSNVSHQAALEPTRRSDQSSISGMQVMSSDVGKTKKSQEDLVGQIVSGTGAHRFPTQNGSSATDSVRQETRGNFKIDKSFDDKDRLKNAVQDKKLSMPAERRGPPGH